MRRYTSKDRLKPVDTNIVRGWKQVVKAKGRKAEMARFDLEPCQLP